MSATDLFPLGDGAVACFHPDKADTIKDVRAGWRKARAGRRWTLRYTAHPFQVVATHCPDCPAVATTYLSVMADGFSVQMAPYVFVPEGALSC